MSNAADNTHSAPSAPRPAATILLLREAGAGVEVLVVRRHANLSFMGGQWVFPGGTLNAADSSDGTLALIGDERNLSCHRMRSLQGQPLPARECLGLAMAACRETFEETGILLATHSSGQQLAADVPARLQSQRALIVEQPAKFIELLRQEDLRPDIVRLLYWAHWITPSTMPRRFDTRFFIVAAPPAQPVIADSSETVESAWMQPAQLIDAAHRGEMPISHPTLYNLHELEAALQRHRTLDRLLANEASRPIAPVLPKMLRDSATTSILLPWNPAYAGAPGEGVPAETEYPQALRSLNSLIKIE